jgi:hypothetical protein
MVGGVVVALLILSLYFVQEGIAQWNASSGLVFFVDYPDWALPVSIVTSVVLVLTLALDVLTIVKRRPLGRGVLAGAVIGIILLVVLTSAVGGPDAVRTIIDPSN